jgi:hypothetical protein
LKKLTVVLLITVLLAGLTCSLAQAAAGDIWLAGYLLLTLKTPNDAKAFQQRVDTVQLRANDLLAFSSTIPSVDVRKSGGKVSIFADNKVFLTVTADDARVNKTTVDKLARSWAQRLRKILPDATPVKH